MTELLEIFRNTFNTDAVEIYDGTVTAVNEDDWTVTVDTEDFPDDGLGGIKLQAIITDGKPGIVVVPTIGSEIVYGQIRGQGDFTVLKVSEIDRIVINASVKVELNAPETVFNSGENRGLVLIGKLEDNLNSLKTFVEAMHAALPGAFSAVLAGSSANGAAGASSYNGSMSGKSITIKDMENTKIIQ